MPGSFTADSKKKKVAAQQINAMLLLQETALPKVLPNEFTKLLPKDFTGSLYCAGKAGMSYPGLLIPETQTIEPVKLFWPKAMIQEMAAKLTDVPVYVTHDTIFDTSRVSIAHTDGAFYCAKGAYFFTLKKMKKTLPYCSVEVSGIVENEILKSITNISGVALLDDPPALPDAKIIFKKQEKKMPKPQIDTEVPKRVTTFSEVLSFIKNGIVFPSQIYNEKDILEDRGFNLMTKEDHDKALAEVATSNEKIKAELDGLKKDASLQKLSDDYNALLADKLEKKELTQKQFDYLKKCKLEDSVTPLDKFHTSNLAKFDELKAIFDVQNEDDTKDDTKKPAKTTGLTDMEEMEKQVNDILTDLGS